MAAGPTTSGILNTRPSDGKNGVGTPFRRDGRGELRFYFFEGGRVMKRVMPFAQTGFAFVVVVLAASWAVAGDMTLWVGRDLDNNNVFWTCSNAFGNDWTLKKNGTVVAEYQGVTSTGEFVELQLKGVSSYDRVRLYRDKLSMNREGSQTAWIQMARGKWSD
jgi:hypothetical protein